MHCIHTASSAWFALNTVIFNQKLKQVVTTTLTYHHLCVLFMFVILTGQCTLALALGSIMYLAMRAGFHLPFL